MQPPSIGAKDLLVAANVGVFDDPGNDEGWPIFISQQPPNKDRCITLIDGGGLAPDPAWLLNEPSLQILIRGRENEYPETYAKTIAVRNALLGLPSQEVNGDWWVSVTQIGEFAFLGYDEKNRPEFSINFRIIIEPAPSADVQYRLPL